MSERCDACGYPLDDHGPDPCWDALRAALESIFAWLWAVVCDSTWRPREHLILPCQHGMVGACPDCDDIFPDDAIDAI